MGVVKVLDNIADIGMLEGVEISCTEQIEERIRVACHSENILDPPNVIVEILWKLGVDRVLFLLYILRVKQRVDKKVTEDIQGLAKTFVPNTEVVHRVCHWSVGIRRPPVLLDEVFVMAHVGVLSSAFCIRW